MRFGITLQSNKTVCIGLSSIQTKRGYGTLRTLAIGDIHGCFKSLTKLAEYVRLEPGDRLITLGDYVDRGPESRSVLDWLIARKAEGILIPLRGNHELMMLAARESQRHFDEWIACGGNAVLDSYGSFGHKGTLDDVPEIHWRFINSCRPFYETSSHIFVHACVYPELELCDQPDYMLYWERFDSQPPHESGRVRISGHTPQRDGLPRSIGNAVCIDTWAHGGGWLTCLDVNSGHYWQANERGNTRSAQIEATCN